MTLKPVESHEAVLEMDRVVYDFRNGSGVYDLSFSFPRGIIVGLIGPSGCGKTTTLRLLTGTYRPMQGEVRVLKKEPALFSDQDKKKIGYIPQHFTLFERLSVKENMHFMGGLYGMSPLECERKMRPILEFAGLHEARNRLAVKLSGGMQRRLMLAGALLHDPEVIFADEPTAGIDPILRARIWENFRQLRDEGRTILVTTQYVGEAAYCDRVAILRNGRLIELDSPEGLRRQAISVEIIHLQVEMENTLPVITFLKGLPQVIKAEAVKGEPGGIFVHVEDAGRALPVLLFLMREKSGMVPLAIELYRPPFDEVFVRLIEQWERKG